LTIGLREDVIGGEALKVPKHGLAKPHGFGRPCLIRSPKTGNSRPEGFLVIIFMGGGISNGVGKA